MLPLGSLRRQPQIEPVVWCYADCEEVLGRGCSGTVRLARTRSNGQLCAVKAVSKKNWHDAALQEARVLKILAGHDGIVRLLDTFEDECCVYLVLEHLDGRDLLDDIVKRTQGCPASERYIAGIMRQVFDALAYCHDEHQVAHRDVKPDNIMLTTSSGGHGIPNAKLIDFGCAALLTERVEFAGTLPYMAPEAVQHSGQSTVSSSQDAWSAGVVLHAMLVGQLLPKEVQRGLTAWSRSGEEWQGAGAPSQMASELLTSLLRLEPRGRLTAARAAEHPWIEACLEDCPVLERPPEQPEDSSFVSPKLVAAARAFAQAAGPKVIRNLLKQLSVLDVEPHEPIRLSDVDAMLLISQVGAASPTSLVTSETAREALNSLCSDSSPHVLRSTWFSWLEVAAQEASNANNLDAALLSLERDFSSKRPVLSDASTRAPTPRDEALLDVTRVGRGGSTARRGGA